MSCHGGLKPKTADTVTGVEDERCQGILRRRDPEETRLHGSLARIDA